MAVLGAINYDPAIAVSKATSSLLAQTAFDTSNLRITFTAPASGNVLVKIRGGVIGATTYPRILLGVLEGLTIRLRMSPIGGIPSGLATNQISQEVIGCVTGLTPGNSYTWDASYGVEIVVGSTNIKYGGPDDASGADAYGGLLFEVWDAANLLAACLYDPSVAVSKSTTSLLAMTSFDTSNLRCAFTAPASGKVQWRIRAQMHGTNTPGQVLLGVLESSTVVGRVAPALGNPTTQLANSCFALEASGIAAVSAGSHSFDAAYAVQTVANAGGAIKYGGPDNTTTNDAFGAFAFDVWAA